MKSKLSYSSRIKKLLKYILITLISFISLDTIPTNKLNINEIIIISSIVAVSFVLLDIISPTITKFIKIVNNY